MGVLAVLAVALLAGWPLLEPRLIATHDAASALARLMQVVRYAGDGQWLVRWAPDFHYGYGGPLFLYYPPGFSYLAALPARAGMGLVSALQATALALWMASGLGAYVLTRRWIGRSGATLAAVAFLLSPYHITLVYVRGAMAEFAAMALLPWVVWLTVRAIEPVEAGVGDGGWRWRLPAALAVSALVATHPFIAMVSLTLLAAGIVWAAWRAPAPDRVHVLAVGAGTLALGMALSAWFWLPMLVGWGDVAMQRVIDGPGSYRDHFVPLRHLLGWGPAPGDVAVSIGSAHLALSALALIRLPWLRWSHPSVARLVGVVAVVGALAAVLMLPIAEPVWRALRPLQAGQFPWRLHTILSLAVAVLAGASVVGWPWPIHRALVGAGVAALLALNLQACRPAYTFVDNRIGTSQAALDGLRRAFPSLWWEDFLPIAAAHAPPAAPIQPLSVVEGALEVEASRLAPIRREFTVRAAAPARVEVGILYLPGWRLWIDGRLAPLHPAAETGLIRFDVPPATRSVRLEFRPTLAGRAGVWLSLAALLLAIWRLVARASVQRNRRNSSIV
jgi:hypothetical protein